MQAPRCRRHRLSGRTRCLPCLIEGGGTATEPQDHFSHGQRLGPNPNLHLCPRIAGCDQENAALTEHRAFTIQEFCANNSISKSTFFKLQSQGLAPRVMHVGEAIRISSEDQADWVEKMRARAETPEGRKLSAERRAKMVEVGRISAQSPRHVSNRGKRRKRSARITKR
jgi:hypothetical protein